MNSAEIAYKLSFQISPIILTGGIADAIPGGMLPIISITEAINFPIGLLGSGGPDIDLDSFFANFNPLPGSTLVDQQIGRYPFANQAVAANATIAQPLGVSLEMICPARAPGGFAAKIATMNALRATLAQHNALGGTYTVATPACFYDNCILLRVVDVSPDVKQPQSRYRWDFERPLLTLQQAQQAQNSLMAKISSGVPLGGDPPTWSGLQPTLGLPASIAGPSIVPALTSPSGASVASPNALFG